MANKNVVLCGDARMRRRVSITFTEPSMTKQSMMAECDINSIVERSRVQGVVNHVNAKTPMYADVSRLVDYQSALNLVNSASDVFRELPAKVRERFGNNPEGLIAFLDNPANEAEGIELGLLKKRDLPASPAVKAPEADKVK